MSKPSSNEKRQVALDLVYKVLSEVGAPLHYAELATRLEQLGWKYLGKGRADHTLYAYIYGDTKDQGESSRFRFVRKGIFALSGQQLTEEQLAQVQRPPRGSTGGNGTDPIVKRGETAAKYKLSIPKTCGYCSKMCYAGPHEVTLESGTCDDDERSGRPFNRSTDPACPFWSPRSPAKRLAEQERRALLIEIINVRNASVQRGSIRR